ncbi:hypothetical protein XMM379_003019 [Aliiroseovarius sp. xm-m-379]|uniref:GFA family protein n=1 Tax=unclassified Aliiroseovarius TaxID=2623558 RepID=UPI0015684360|nr:MULTISPECIES: GFA family protein [unclassified Aliiroseovarius]NRP26305.1 hypothetical protein [Aliiroseovarius sp. xm-m-379]NRP31981.1 hypothetical protein [Aliiroseovarius sp. xm-m-314]NRP35104.1 hypothetical protein [Aliiroseovarius sp. xm-a-104]NRP45814.1 hypothetical protein [Aliiroseovarius sp. xm-m-378]NRP51373.1 hypothetical protein [Aliiroseovarius sp. xm-m-354]
MIRGSCLCGAIHFETDAKPKGASMCHCSQCRKQSGGIWSSAQVPVQEITITGPVSWYQASPQANRGSCPTCGAFLFWQGVGEDNISVSLGAVDGPTGLALEKHIFVADKGDYYQIADGLPQEDQ